MPRKERSAVPRSIEGAESLMSCQVGSKPVTFLVKTSRCSFCSRLLMISAKPNTPIATETKPMPSESSETPKLKRATPELTSVPTRPSSRPRITIAIALMSEPWASTVAAMRPSTISEKYSAGPHPDQRAEDHPHEAIKQVLKGERDAEAQAEIGKERFHRRYSKNAGQIFIGSPNPLTKA